MHKTIVACTGIVALGAVCLAVVYWYTKYLSITGVIKMDRFTQCIQTVMSESRQGGNVIDAEKAKDICVHAKKDSDKSLGIK